MKSEPGHHHPDCKQSIKLRPDKPPRQMWLLRALALPWKMDGNIYWKRLPGGLKDRYLRRNLLASRDATKIIRHITGWGQHSIYFISEHKSLVIDDFTICSIFSRIRWFSAIDKSIAFGFGIKLKMFLNICVIICVKFRCFLFERLFMMIRNRNRTVKWKTISYQPNFRDQILMKKKKKSKWTHTNYPPLIWSSEKHKTILLHAPPYAVSGDQPWAILQKHGRHSICMAALARLHIVLFKGPCLGF